MTTKKNEGERKRGKLSLKERSFIKENCHQLDIAQLAERCNRTEAPIRRFLKDHRLTHSQMSKKDTAITELKDKLQLKHYWKELQMHFFDDELIYFEEQWTHLMHQFREDLTAAEENQVIKLITTDVLINRTLRETKKLAIGLDKKQTLINKLYEGEPTPDQMLMAVDMETGMEITRAHLKNLTKEHNELLQKYQQLNKDLKATRDQRKKVADDGKKTWSDLIKMVEDEDIRDREGEMAAIISYAAEKSFDKMSEYHEYIDGSVDTPILNEKTVMRNNDEKHIQD